MRTRRFLWYAILIGVFAATTAAAFAATTDWGTAIEVPSTAALNTDDAKVTAVSCASAGNCAAGGYYNSSRAFVVSEKNGVWGPAVAVPNGGYVNSISCATAGSCGAGGSYTDHHGHIQAFVVTESHGVWGTAIKVPGLTRLNRGGLAVMYSISCPKPGFCAAGGTYDDGVAGGQAWVANERRGVWHKAIEVPGTAALNFGGHAEVRSISCATARSCAAGGLYFGKGAGPNPKGFVVNEKNGVWKQAIKLTGSRAFNHSSDWVNSISCATARSCAAGGPGFVVNKTSGVWRKAIKVPLEVDSISCAKAGWCAAGGREDGKALVVTEKNGIWRKAMEVPGSAALNVGGSAQVSSVSCSAAGSCAAGGYYNDGSHDQAFVVTETNGVWSDAAEVPGSADLNLGGDARVAAVSCATASSCVAGGFYTDGSDFRQAFVTSP